MQEQNGCLGGLIGAIQRSQDPSLRSFLGGSPSKKPADEGADGRLVKQEMSTGHITEESVSAHNSYLDLLVQSKRIFEKASKTIDDLENLESLRCNSALKQDYQQFNPEERDIHGDSDDSDQSPMRHGPTKQSVSGFIKRFSEKIDNPP